MEPHGLASVCTPTNVEASGGTAINVQLYLLRHATHADFGRRLTGRAPGVPLTPEGERQAAVLGRRLAPEALTEIQTSPRERARATAEAVARASGASVTVVDALDEIDFGDWTGAEFAALNGQPLWDDWNTRRALVRIPSGESMDEAAGRIARHVDALAASGTGGRIALVTHCDMIRALVARVLGLSFDNILRFEIGPASVSRLEAGPWGARVLSLNETTGMTA
ncbi:histidine phosphatase family protein [Rubellimicrobium rubrum]|uniref:Histidine phosphatase family protein n=1 Tax=Rubellimicrobium rubrum TaxID=2585369 RepID=A0A5C4MX20_9RHOB|nr:histidine phosphatase family protein [Rubellimicrobium rubrum]TNC48479.1 histidine phosphatase family protein [Rubellimicrobium rubrum]